MIYLCIAVMAVLSAACDRFAFKKKSGMSSAIAEYAVLYYFFIVLVRTLSGNGDNYLSYSFYGKSLSGYVKAMIFIFAIYAFLMIFSLIVKKYEIKRFSSERMISRFAALFVMLLSLYIVLFSWPDMLMVVIMGMIALVVTLICCVNDTTDALLFKKSADNKPEKETCIDLLITSVLFVVMYMIAGPMEFMVYNKGDFLYSYLDVVPYLLAGSAVYVAVVALLIPLHISKKLCSIYSMICRIFCILSYMQSMFFNGRMELVDGGVQEWDVQKKVLNILLWIAIAAVIIIVLKVIKNGSKITKIVASYIIAIQCISVVFMLITADVFYKPGKQLVHDGTMELSKENNVVVFILDAYDVQMLAYITDEDPGYIEPLHDFTYYDNMSSRYGATDGSLPYLLTGADLSDPETEKDQNIWYEQTHFLSDIKDAGYDIRILTDRKYVDRLNDGLIDNYTEENYCVLDAEKTISLFLRCMKYKYMPFLFKNEYKYEQYDITNVIMDTNVYIFGTDAAFDESVLEEGIICTDEKSFRIYHLYGAHSPYYLTENAELDYNSTPIAQWRGSLKIVYDYMDALKEKNLYDDTTLIIMADHGYNNTQRKAVEAAGLSYIEDRSNPIFFIKRRAEQHDKLIINSDPTSHDRFFDTILESVDITGQYYGSVWE